MDFLIGFDDEQALDAKIVGQKFCSLAKAFRAGFAVPQAVAISTRAHQYFLTNNSWPDGLADEVYSAASALEISRGLSIRSSATREDLEKQSFAGQYRSFLQIVDKKDLKHNIETCWRSVSSDAVQSYLRAKKPAGYQIKTPLMGVVIQKMVNAIAAGIAFGRNPMRPAGNEIVIEAVEGLAEDLVSGRTSPYRAVVDADGMVNLTTPESKSRLNESQSPVLQLQSFWRDIANLVRKLETHNGQKPLDIEWAIDIEKTIWLLQSRPITTIGDEAREIPSGLWTRKIANDLWADRLTPFLADHMLTRAPQFDLSRTLGILGIRVMRPTLTVINGYLYINCHNALIGRGYLPAWLQLPEMIQLLPPSIRASQQPSHSVWKLVSVGLRSPLLALLEPGVNPFLCPWLAKRHRQRINRQIDQIATMPAASSRETVEKIQAVTDILSRLQIYNQWPYFFATVTTWVLRWLIVIKLGRSHTEFLDRISQKASNVTITIERTIRDMARQIANKADLADRFLDESAHHLVADLPPSIQAWLDNFLACYGSRSRHRTLLVKRWAEAPEEVIGVLQSLVRSQHLQEMNAAEAQKPVPVTTELQPLSSTARLTLWLTTHFTRRFIDEREELRFALDRVLYLLRQTLLILGQQTDLGDRVLFLKARELERLVKGDLSSAAARFKARSRYECFGKPFDVATYYNNGQAENEFESSGQVLNGIGTSPGRIQGRAKIVDDPNMAEIESGQILIAKNTDPGWTPILSVVKGMVMEEGGLLNHCSIVARELGIPSVVGVRGATRKIQDNDLVTIDGGLGVVKIER